MTRRYACPIAGCKTVYVIVAAQQRHARQPHMRCSCGWVGVKWATHRSYRGESDCHLVLE